MKETISIMEIQEGREKRIKVYLKQQWLGFWSKTAIKGDPELTSPTYTPNLQLVTEQFLLRNCELNEQLLHNMTEHRRAREVETL